MGPVVVRLNPGDDRSAQLARRLQLPLLDTVADYSEPVLFYQEDKLTLALPAEPDAGTVCVDFTDPGLAFRLSRQLSQEAVVKAVGGVVSRCPGNPVDGHLIDATAGLGLDAFILAAAGWQVTLVEQSPIIHALLHDGLLRGQKAIAQFSRAEPSSSKHQRQWQMLAETISRLHLCDAGDSADLMATLPPAAVIYLDPMFPAREKTARVKKNRYLLQRLHGDEGVGVGLLPLALGLAPKVVVKRPRQAANLDGQIPASSLTGKTSRFDIYVGNTRPSGEQQTP